MQNYAQSTIREMLGWYGLQDGGAGGGGGGAGGGEPISNGPTANLKLLATSRVDLENNDLKPPGVTNDSTTDSLVPYTNGWDSRPLHAIDCK